MTEKEKMFKLDEIIVKRFPPIIWEILGYTLSLYSFFTSNYNIGYCMIVLTALYFLSNYIFDSFTLMIELNDPDLNIIFETKEPINLKWWQNFLWIDKKFISVKYERFKIPDDDTENQMYKNNNIDNNYNYSNEQKYIINNQLKFEAYTMVDDSTYLEHLLYFFYIMGITKKIFIYKKTLYSKMNYKFVSY